MLFRLLPVLLVTTSCASPTFGQVDFSDVFGVKQEANSVDVSAELLQVDAQTVELRVTVTPPTDFYIYSTTTPKGQKTRITLNETAGLQPAQQGFVPDHPAKKKYNEDFAGDVETYMSAVTWSQQLKSASALSGTIRVSGSIKGQICTEGQGDEGGICVLLIPPPEFSAELVADESFALAVPQKSVIVPSGYPSKVMVTQDNIADDKANIGYTVSLLPTDAQPGAEVTLRIQADIAKGWHTYSTTMSPDVLGGTPTRISLKNVAGLEKIDERFKASSVPRNVANPLGDALEVHEDSVTWTQRFVVTDINASIIGSVFGQLCTDRICEIPGSASFAVALGGTTEATSVVLPMAGSDSGDGGSRSDGPEETLGVTAGPGQEGLWGFLLTAVVAGYVALLTPCVFPMIPVTVAFFLKQGESGKGNTKFLAVIYCLGIVGSFTVIGVLVSVLFGSQKMNELANGAWLNLLFAVVFVAFALMLMGVFELRMPTSLLNWSAQREGKGGLLGVMFMALTFTLVSFTCTAAFVASILAMASQGHIIWPTLGMLAFSTAFASPFFFLALFPDLLSRLPKSGGWMQKVKCTAGLVELALAVKFLSVADIGFSPTATPRFVDFSTAMVLWATLAFVTGLYLLGVFRFSKDTPTDGISPIGGLWAMASIGLGLLICVGMFSPTPPDSWMWKRLVGFAPPRFESAVGAGGSHAAGVKDEFAELATAGYALSHDGLVYSLQLDQAVRIAQENNRPVFVDFTGVNCQNCRDMENDVLNRPNVVGILSTLPRAQLYLDRIPTVRAGEESDRLLQKNQELSLQLTGGYAMPTYVILHPDGRRVLSKTSGVVSSEKFTQFLETGIRKFEESQKDVAVRMQRKDGQL